ncbi:hypothetical protein DS2_07043 [Catenovulum agarivorans DS-2]|uniref:Uncharacterized protein n=2 Tax=Catenovulum agarivorans TaxID=1172192 RepID=W7QRV4_9ALTE|nr:hypothetical protein DS2_07043 [Catenovulum agarivorans DS-2]
MFAGYTSKTGACIAHELGREKFCDISISDLRSSDESWILVSKSTGITEKKAQWIVTDQIPYPDVKNGENLHLGSCRINGKFVHTLSAVVSEIDAEWLPAVRWAANVDLSTGTISTINAKGVECLNEGWGI